MDVFALRDELVTEYRKYAESFLTIRDERIRERVDREFDRGLFWPDPRIQLNPAFEPGGYVYQLVEDGLLHEECERIFRRGKESIQDQGDHLQLHQHQADAIRAAARGDDYVLTTGTGSGKSLAYIVPIVDRVLREGPKQGRVQAIVVYPMNALANSQLGELEKFLCNGYPDGVSPVSFARYTGQESDDRRNEIIADPPDILLTNYVMLELILTRPLERKLVQQAQDLRFLVLDELHTYRGRQGADVALLARRVREACRAENLQCVGTSATLAGPGSYEEQRAEVARVATQLFGAEVKPESVIGETLRPATAPFSPQDDADRKRLAERVSQRPPRSPSSDDEFRGDALACWIEQTFGMSQDETGRLVRSRPRPLTGPDGAGADLAALTGHPEKQCVEAIKECLAAGAERRNPANGFPIFAFRLHQFFSGGGSIAASLEGEAARHLTTSGQAFVPGDRTKALFPLAFCRECGQEYYIVRIARTETGGQVLEPRELSDRSAGPGERNGYLHLSAEAAWSTDPDEVATRVPADWLDPISGRVARDYRRYLPEQLELAHDGTVGASDVVAHFIETPFRFCVECGVGYSGRQGDFGKLAILGAGGRSTSTTVLTMGALRRLIAEHSIDPEARKLLSFTDNRQDASLQAGHFNDFVDIGLLRSALHRAAETVGEGGIKHDVLTQAVFEALALDPDHYAADPDLKGIARRETDEGLRNVLGYRLYRDLQRGWRLTSPNLEQVGLLEVRYEGLDEAADDPELWEGTHDALAHASPETRQRVCTVLLDWMRRELAIKVDYLDADQQERIKQQSSQRLKSPWAIDEEERLEHAAVVLPRARRPHDSREYTFLSARGLVGQFLRRNTTFPDFHGKLTLDDTERVIAELLGAMRRYGLVEVVLDPKEGAVGQVPGYQVTAAGIRWIARDGSKRGVDPLRTTRRHEAELSPNEFFVDFYSDFAADGRGLEAREHTAQVKAEDRRTREERFREARLPLLFCSPTMELGVDIAQLNVVNLRNVPPTPANYAQRSGRAGRSGQPALVFTFCSSWNSHDQYFFRRPDRMVAGQVAPPQIDLANEDLVRAHIHALWLAEAGMSLGRSLRDVLQVEGEEPALEILPAKLDDLRSPSARGRAKERARRVLSTLVKDLEDTDWYSERWLESTLDGIEGRFERACDRWRDMYRNALGASKAQTAIIQDATRDQSEKRRAKRLRSEAESQLDLLLAAEVASFQSDFYSYRYFASEGFLPGYSFPRLPISAYVAGRRTRKTDEFVSRPRFLAITEFGPRSIIYHEGARFIINQVMLPVGEGAGEDGDLPLRSAKQCGSCGYLHPLLAGEPGPDLCERCGRELITTLRSLLRMQNVSTKRRDRISSDEEERVRQGFEVQSGVYFESRDGRHARRTGQIHSGGARLAKLDYGAAATVWRINLGWARRADREQLGFVLDVQNGYWATNEQALVDEQGDPMSKATRRVIPYVEDHRNCILIEPERNLTREQMASLQAGLKRGIEAVFQLEESELAAEPLPTAAERRVLLFYEAAEGGAGVLRRLLDDPPALVRIAREALEICHFDPDSGEDRGSAPYSDERCEAACYDCLLSYSNQRDHRLLDRFAIRALLLGLKDSKVEAAAGSLPPDIHLEQLLNLCDSDLEREWLHELHERGLRLPSHAQRLVSACRVRPDFSYAEQQTVVFVDGPDHDDEHQAHRDRVTDECLANAGYEVVRFRYDNRDRWNEVLAEHPSVFGAGAGAPTP
jgi:superfamily II DNA/RNA helicase/very-short-patch-repair endonuclease